MSTLSNNQNKSTTEQGVAKIAPVQSEFEKIPCQIYNHAHDCAVAIACHIADTIRQRQQENRNCVLGLATGSTPVSIYNELVRQHQAGELSLANVVTFNLDEYLSLIHI